MKTPKEVALLELSQRTTVRYLKKGDAQKFMGDGKKFARRMKGNEAAQRKLQRLAELSDELLTRYQSKAESDIEKSETEDNWRRAKNRVVGSRRAQFKRDWRAINRTRK